MNVWDFLNSINTNKTNLFESSEAPEALDKLYSPFVVSRALSYSPECLLYAAELNQRGLKEFAIPNRMHYEFYLNSIPKGKRFNKWAKPEKDEFVDLIMSEFNYSREKALAVLPLINEEERQAMITKQYGGVIK